MADALDSKSSIRKGVWVQVPPSAFCINSVYSVYSVYLFSQNISTYKTLKNIINVDEVKETNILCSQTTINQ